MERSKQLEHYYKNIFTYKQYYIKNRLKILERQKLYKERVDREYTSKAGSSDHKLIIRYGKFWVHFD